MKSKGVAYLLWFFLGLIGIHKFYLGKIGMGILYLLTGGIFGIGWFIDLFTLGNQVDIANALLLGKTGGLQQSQSQNIVVNVAAPASAPSATEVKVSAEKQILSLSQQSGTLSIKDIISKTSLEMDEAETAVKKLVDKGMAKEVVTPEGKTVYDFD